MNDFESTIMITCVLAEKFTVKYTVGTCMGQQRQALKNLIIPQSVWSRV